MLTHHLLLFAKIYIFAFCIKALHYDKKDYSNVAIRGNSSFCVCITC